MGKNAFERALDIITLVGSAITLGCVMGMNKMDKDAEKNKASASSTEQNSDSKK